MKHTIVIKDIRDHIVENTISQVISNPAELRQRIVKRFPKSKIYFRTLSENNGRVYINHRLYHWFIDSCFEERAKRPKTIPGKHIHRATNNDISLGAVFNTYGVCEGDVIKIPAKDNLTIAKQYVNTDCHVYLVRCIINGHESWCNCRDLRDIVDSSTIKDALDYLCGKTIKVTEAIRNPLIPYPVERGMLTGKGICWMLRPICYIRASYKHEII